MVETTTTIALKEIAVSNHIIGLPTNRGGKLQSSVSFHEERDTHLGIGMSIENQKMD
jgi:hypothetical protein